MATYKVTFCYNKPNLFCTRTIEATSNVEAVRKALQDIKSDDWTKLFGMPNLENIETIS